VNLLKYALEDGTMDIVTEIGAASGLFKVKGEVCTKGQIGLGCVCINPN
jgi:hypothetical protein